jgi:hypothetical protein
VNYVFTSLFISRFYICYIALHVDVRSSYRPCQVTVEEMGWVRVDCGVWSVDYACAYFLDLLHLRDQNTMWEGVLPFKD